MKKHILFALLPLAFAACEDVQEGSSIGGDAAPSVVLYQYSAEETSGYDPDCTAKIRLAVNNATESLYLLTESAADYATYYSGDDEAYAEHVIEAGKKIETTDLVVDSYVEAFGQNYITAVAVKGGEKSISTTASFYGVKWNTVEGTEDYVYVNFAGGVCQPVLQQREDIPTTYRLKGVDLGDILSGDTPYNLTFSLLTDDEGNEVGGVDSQGNSYTFVTVDAHNTGYTYGSYGNVYVRDIATYTGNPAYSTTSYGCIMTGDNQVELVLNYYVSAGNIKQIAEDYFGPAE